MTDPLEKLRSYNRPSTGDAWSREVQRLLAELFDSWANYGGATAEESRPVATSSLKSRVWTLEEVLEWLKNQTGPVEPTELHWMLRYIHARQPAESRGSVSEMARDDEKDSSFYRSERDAWQKEAGRLADERDEYRAKFQGLWREIDDISIEWDGDGEVVMTEAQIQRALDRFPVDGPAPGPVWRDECAAEEGGIYLYREKGCHFRETGWGAFFDKGDLVSGGEAGVTYEIAGPIREPREPAESP